MSFNTSYNKIITDDNLMETIQHGASSYPFQFYYDNLALFDFNCIEWHWHTELEVVYIESGTVTFWIGEKQFTCPARHIFLIGLSDFLCGSSLAGAGAVNY